MIPTVTILIGDALRQLRKLPDESVQCCVTSPPYWDLRDYGVKGQIGSEKSPEEHITVLVKVLREVHRVLRSDGTLWVNYGDAYASSGKNRTEAQASAKSGLNGGLGTQLHCLKQQNKVVGILKPKDLIGLPWMLAFALRADGWYLRQDIIWHKPNPMPESCGDRCTKAHEYLFLLSKSSRYYYDAASIREPYSINTKKLSFETMNFQRRVMCIDDSQPVVNLRSRCQTAGIPAREGMAAITVMGARRESPLTIRACRPGGNDRVTPSNRLPPGRKMAFAHSATTSRNLWISRNTVRTSAVCGRWPPLRSRKPISPPFRPP